MNFVFEYIKYRWKAKGRHGTHSPFIYKLVDECLRTPVEKEDQIQINSLLNQLSKDQRVIQVADFGAGSKTLKKERKISDILRISSSKGKYASLFYQLARFYKPERILEFGTSLGIGTIHLAKGNPDAAITTVEACTETAKIAQENFQQTKTDAIALVNTTFDSFLNENDLKSYDLIFIDGHHDGIALLRYVDMLESCIHDETFLILDDIRWSDSMFEAWEQLRKDNRFHVSVDLLRMGMLLKRSGQRKEHFIVKV